ncbi:Annexin [Penicillium chermesinum]|uniref:Annexin n=1 Tax=Penicillium chermesinum TaxID=63820 RepID=A0A9W9NK33_9EURO|nr:Annexin [Penicillium chermesinum]KAJ5220103.1 Annexin [Penicillium chermesinum]
MDSLQVRDPRRSRSKSPGRTRERSASRDNRVPSPSPSRSRDSRPRSSAPELARPASRSYDSDEEAEIERQYKLMKQSRLRADKDEAKVVSRAPRSPARYDVKHSDSDEDRRNRNRMRNDRDRNDEKTRHRGDRYEISDDERDLRTIQPREYPGRSRPPPSPAGGRGPRHESDESDDESVDDDLAYGDAPGSHPSYAKPGKYQYAQPSHYLHAQPGQPGQPGAGGPQSRIEVPPDWAPVPECEQPGFVPPSSQAGGGMPGTFPGASYPNMPSTAPTFPAPQYAQQQQQHPATSGPYAPSQYRTAPGPEAPYPPQPAGVYANPNQYQYAHVDGEMSDYHYAATTKQGDQAIYPYRYTNEPQFSDKPSSHSRARSHSASITQPQEQQQQQQFLEIAPGGRRSGGRPHSLSVSSNNLAVGGPQAVGGHPPASPLLEPYRGTYQSMSPMPSPIVIPSVRDEDISDIEGLDGTSSNSETRRRKKHSRSKSSSEKDLDRDYRSSKEKLSDRDRDRKEGKSRRRPTVSTSNHGPRDSHSSVSAGDKDAMVLISPSSGRKRVSFYDAGADAETMQEALNHTRNIDNKAITSVLPRLTSDEILRLRTEYKARVKVQGKGINLAKHLRLKLGNSSFGKIAYATALGRWESEAYWANCYYQAGTSRRELLIESLIGRSNAAIREIKACFRDTRYGDSLERCMRSELRADKFRVAVLLALEERRQEEREPLDTRLVRQDVADLHRALISREGGETAMINIIVLRSDSHLREVLRAYEHFYEQNFAKAMIAKSRNLVGETLAHILNGAINRPMRDALLLHQALRESKSGRERSELLISRLVRLHWEPRHLEQVKSDYRRRYGERIEEAIAEEIMTSSGGSDWGEFCIELVHSSS